MNIRAYEDSDEVAVIQLWQDCGLVAPQNNPIRDIQRKSQVNPEWFLVGLQDGTIVASCMAGYEGHRGWINYLAVTPTEQRKGLAREMMAEAERLLRETGCAKINLQIRATNTEVIAFYENIGFTTDPAISMGKRLEEDPPFHAIDKNAHNSEKFSTDFTLTTTRCLLRHISEADIPHVFSASRIAGFNHGMVWDPPHEQSELLESHHEFCKAWKEGSAYVFTIESKEDFIGRVSIRSDEKPGLWNLGFWTHPQQQGKGFMTEAVKRILTFGFEQLGAIEIEACHASWNEASKRVLEKSGFIQREHLEQGFQKQGNWVPEERLSIKKSAEPLN